MSLAACKNKDGRAKGTDRPEGRLVMARTFRAVWILPHRAYHGFLMLVKTLFPKTGAWINWRPSGNAVGDSGKAFGAASIGPGAG